MALTITEGQGTMKLHNPTVTKILTNFIKYELPPDKKALIGLSGGIDSAVAAALTQMAIGSERLILVSMPSASSSKDSRDDAREQAKLLNVPFITVEIKDMVESFHVTDKDMSPLRLGNIMARARMVVLYDLSAKYDALVIGTSNKTELMLGYGTIYGDMSSAINPIGDLYKTQLRSLAKELNIYPNIITKKPSADLYEGQADESEIGYSYDDIDMALYYMLDMGYGREHCIQLGVVPSLYDYLHMRWRTQQFKRRMPIIAKLNPHTIDKDFHYMRDWK